jgi:leader peptidase (prepilin peptidase)/N-methyltransferase
VALGLSPDAHGLAGAILGWALLLLVVLDIRHLWLPDAITLPLLALGLLAGPAPWQDRVLSAAIAGGGLLMVHGVYRAIRGRDGLGLGDVKLGAALGAWLSPVLLPPLLLLAAGLGLLLVVVATVGRGRAPRAVPFGACLAVAGWLLWAVATSV